MDPNRRLPATAAGQTAVPQQLTASRLAPVGQSSNNSNNNSSSVMDDLKSAIEAGETKRVLELLKLGVPIVIDQDGQTALHLAASAGSLDLVEALIQAGCDVGIQDFVSWSIYLYFLNLQPRILL